MVRLADTETVTEVIVSTLVPLVRPELILLFGSRVTGGARDDSDFDLMLVLPDDADVEAERLRASSALRAAGISADVLARTAMNYRRWQHDPGYMDWMVSRDGRVLHASGAVAQRDPIPRVRERPREGLALWMQRSDADFQVAKTSLTSDIPVPDAICFHAHACIEKRLKALIVRGGTFPPKTHELPELLGLVPETVRHDTDVVQGCAVLQELYPKSRYPEAGMPTIDEARVALEAATLVRERLDGM